MYRRGMRVYAREEVRRKLVQYHNIDGNENLFAQMQDYRADYLYSLLYQEHSLIDGFDKEMCIYETKYSQDMQG